MVPATACNASKEYKEIENTRKTTFCLLDGLGYVKARACNNNLLTPF